MEEPGISNSRLGVNRKAPPSHFFVKRNLRIPRSDALPLSHRDSTVSEVYYEILKHTARISNVDSLMFVNKMRKMLSFELSKEIDKDVFSLITSVGQRKNCFCPLS